MPKARPIDTLGRRTIGPSLEAKTSAPSSGPTQLSKKWQQVPLSQAENDLSVVSSAISSEKPMTS
jgi:hypothetical protein